MPSMTRARTASYGVVTPPPLDRWIDAVLMLFASLVQGVGATFGMRRWIGKRDWHTQSEAQALPQTKPGIHLKEDTPPPESLSALCRESLLANPRGLASTPHETINRDSRDRFAYPRMTPLMLKHWTRAPWHAFPAEAGIQPARTARSPGAQLSPRSFRRKSESRTDRAPCSILQLQACTSRPTVPGGRALTLSRRAAPSRTAPQ